MKTASIETVIEVLPHPNADRLEIAKVLGWQTVVRKGEFSAGQRVVFVPIDVILPDAEWSAFLKDPKRPDKPIRLNTVKLRGEFSQGLLLPLSVLPECARDWHEGSDVGGALGTKKYEKEVPACLNGVMKGNFPLYLAPKTDEDNALSNPRLVAEVLQYPVTVTQKLDGSSCTIIVRDGVITNVCSRNIDLVEDDKNAFWKVANGLRFASVDTAIIQGELMGPGIQGNQLELTAPELYVFQIKNEDHWLSEGMLELSAALYGAKCVPIICELPAGTTLENLQQLADEQVLPNGKPAEGIVVRPTEPRVYTGFGRPLGFKVINRNYKD